MRLSALMAVLAMVLGLAGLAGCGGGGSGGSADADAVDGAADAPPEVPPAGDAAREEDGQPPPDVPVPDETDADGAGEEEGTALDLPDVTDGQDAADPGTSGAGVQFDRFCKGAKWDEKTEATTLWPLGGTYLGVYNQFPAGTLETMKIVPQHSLHVTKIKAAFAGGPGTAKIRLMGTFGRSYPASWPDIDAKGANLIPPIEIEVDGASADEWVELDVADKGVFLLPTQHYMLVYEHLDVGPFLAIEEVTAGDYSHALILVPGQFEPYGVDGNYRLQVEGDYFCQWSDEERWFGESVGPYTSTGSARAAFADLDRDGHEDLVVNAGGPVPFLGDGKGGFAAPGEPLFPPNLAAGMTVFADLDNDGDEDAFAATWVGWDSDGDKVTIFDGDCNDADAAVGPKVEEVPGNGKDDDCDGTADDGTDAADADADGVSIADGDWDDTNAAIFPGAPELLDGIDNDQDLEVDEDYPNRVLLNDGTGRFEIVPAAGVQTLDPTGAAALGDADGDGNLDVYWGNWLKHYPDPQAVPDRLALGNGDGTFVDVTESAGVLEELPKPCYGVTWCDYDNDGRQDIWVGNYQLKPNYMWHNLGDCKFEEVAWPLGLAQDANGSWGGHTYGGDWGDFDNDGDLDLFEPNLSHPRTMPYSDQSRLMVNGGGPDWKFTDHAPEMGFIYDEGDVNAAWADWDNDGDLDLALATLYTGHYSKLYRNDGDAGFADVTYETNTAVHDAVSAVFADVDEDGDLDLVIADRDGLDAVHLFINRVGQDNHWVQLVLRGTKTNRSGVGARVSLTAGGSTQIREVKGGGGHFNNQSTKLVQIGLGQGTAIDKVTVRWAGGETETFAGVSADQRWLLVEGSGKAEAWSPPADPCAECGAGTVCLDAKCVPDEEAVFARLVQFHAAIEGEDIVALMSHFDPATYEAGADVLLPLNSPVKPLFEVKARFEQMFASLAQIQFDALVTGDGLGNPYAMPDEDTILIADFTPLSGVVEDPAGGYMWVSELQAGDSWYEEHSEGWYNFLFRKVGGSWHAVAFGIGNQ